MPCQQVFIFLKKHKQLSYGNAVDSYPRHSRWKEVSDIPRAGDARYVQAPQIRTGLYTKNVRDDDTPEKG